MSTRIQEAVTFIKATREEAITLAHDVGDAEVHALHIQKGFFAPAQQPVGYMVVPVKRWAGLTRSEAMEIINSLEGQDWRYAVDAIEAKLKEKNT
jgi:hypothetical protein